MDTKFDKAKKVSRRVTLQTRLKTKEKQKKFIEKLGENFSFLEPEATLAVWNRIRSQHLWNPSFLYSNFTNYEAQSNFHDYLENCSQAFLDASNEVGFCFSMDWPTTGIIIIELSEIMQKLNEYMFLFNDDLKFYTPDLTKSLHLFGDRSGTWDKLNELSIHIYGADWIKVWEDQTALQQTS